MNIPHPPLSGRIDYAPDELMHNVILLPQFEYELIHFLPFYLHIEKVSVEEAHHLQLLTADQASKLIAALKTITKEELVSYLTQSGTDISYAIEQAVQAQLHELIPCWHVDKSRNDFQACAQRMFARQQVIENVFVLQHLSSVIMQKADQLTEIPLLAYTHYQAAQIISPAFYLVTINETLLVTLQRLLFAYDDFNHCPLGAGAIAGLELPWDRQRMAQGLGFTEPVRSALTSVADRDWFMKISFEYALLGNALSRFCTDFMAWGSSAYNIIDLPDTLVSISSAMPQKRNFTVLERIRGETAHITSLHFDFFLGQRNTPYTNLVEVSKETGRYMLALFQHVNRVLQLFTLIIEQVQFRSKEMKNACDHEFHAGFALANLLTRQDNIPYRIAQVITGEFITASINNQILPAQLQVTDLAVIVSRYGYHLSINQHQLEQLFDAQVSLHSKHSAGSTHPEQVRCLLGLQQQEYENLLTNWMKRQQTIDNALHF